MRYLGGKSRIAEPLVAAMSADIADCQRFVDVFCGALNVTARIIGVQRFANDGCVPLIRLYEAWREGWRPPDDITRDIYETVKARSDPDDPLTAFVGFACAYSGAWFNGYAHSTKPRPKVPHGEVFAKSAARSLARKLAACSDVAFSALDFGSVDAGSGDVVYCDPEYHGTKRYAYFTEPFDYARFVAHADALARAGACVYVSEYAVQSPTWEQVAEFGNRRRSSTPSGKVEKLFKVCV